MKRSWSIEEGVVEDPVTKTRLEFSSVWTDEVNAGNEPPARDDVLVLRLWSSDRSRVATFQFEREGGFVRSDIDLPEGLPFLDKHLAQKTDNAAVAMEIRNGGPHKEKLVTLQEFE